MTRGMIIDVHCHVHGAEFDADRAEVLAAAAERGVAFALAMGEDAADNERALGAARAGVADPGARVLPCVGLHPERADRGGLEAVAAQLREHAAEIAAVGEVGLDYWIAKEEPERAIQREVLGELVRIAGELDLALRVDSGSAGHQTIDLLAAAGAKRVCMHAFDGAAKHAARAVAELEYLFSIPPSVARSPQKQKLVRRLGLESLLLETDSPVLGPDREARNVPGNALLSARSIAEIKGCPLEEVIERTTENARLLFGERTFE